MYYYSPEFEKELKMAKGKKTVKTTEGSTGKKHIVMLNAEDSLEESFQDLMAKGAKIDLKDAGEYDNYSDFAMFVKDCLKQGKFTKIELLEALYEDDAEYEYEQYKESYSDTDDSFVNFIQDDHGTYSSVLVCETEDEIYLATIEECDAEASYYNVLRELTLAITNCHPGKMTTKETTRQPQGFMSNFATTEKRPTADSKTVNLNNVLNDVLNGQSTPEASVKVLTAPMFTKL